MKREIRHPLSRYCLKRLGALCLKAALLAVSFAVLSGCQGCPPSNYYELLQQAPELCGLTQEELTPAGTNGLIKNPQVAPCFALSPYTKNNSESLEPQFQSLQVFVALNWPASSRVHGAPDQIHAKQAALTSNNGDFSTVWESWASMDRLMETPSGAAPPWEDAGPGFLPWELARIEAFGRKFQDIGLDERPYPRRLNYRSRPFSNELKLLKKTHSGSSVEEIRPGLAFSPQSLHWGEVLYEISMNHTAYEYLRSNNLYATEGQIQFVRDSGQSRAAIEWPADAPANGSPAKRGAIFVKAAWIVIEEEQHKHMPLGASPETIRNVARRFHTTWAVIEPKYEFENKTTRVRLVALAGMHILYQTLPYGGSASDWNWSSFEHVCNAPTLPAEFSSSPTPFKDLLNAPPACIVDPARPESAAWNFFGAPDKNCRAVETHAIATNFPLVYPHLQNTEESQLYLANMPVWEQKPRTCLITVARESPLVHNANQAFAQHYFPDESRLSAYRLVGTQWNLADPQPEADAGSCKNEDPFLPVPCMANTIIEPYIQGESNCKGCHQNARLELKDETQTLTLETGRIFTLNPEMLRTPLDVQQLKKVFGKPR